MSVDQETTLAPSPASEPLGYRSLSPAAVVGLILGLLAPTAILHPLLWLVPAAGAAVSLLALRQIAHHAPHMVGRKAAWAGLLLSLCFGAAGLSDWLVHRALMRREAQHTAAAWFAHLANGEPELAYQMTRYPPDRIVGLDQARRFYHDNPEQRERFEAYLEQPVIRRLLAWGDKAEVCYQDTVGQSQVDSVYQVFQVYAVTHEGAVEEEAVFVGLQLYRLHLDDGETAWRIVNATEDVMPKDSATPEENRKPL